MARYRIHTREIVAVYEATDQADAVLQFEAEYPGAGSQIVQVEELPSDEDHGDAA